MQTMPPLGQGTWHMGDHAPNEQEETAALRAGIEHGMALIDTAEMYGEGRAESLIGRAIRGLDRQQLYLVSKVYPHNAGGARLIAHCEASLARLGVDYLDLYLLHWRGSIPLQETIAGMEKLVQSGKIRRWGVSNFDIDDMEELFALPGGEKCAANQVLYHLGSRGIEYSLKPWMDAHGVPLMAYCPLAQAGSLRRGLVESEAVQAVAQKHGISGMQVLLGFVMAQPNTTAIPKSSQVAHTLENAAMQQIRLDAQDLAQLDAAFPPPTRKQPLDIE